MRRLRRLVDDYTKVALDDVFELSSEDLVYIWPKVDRRLDDGAVLDERLLNLHEHFDVAVHA